MGQWLAEVETRIERIRLAAKGEGQPLTKLNALALAGRWYSWFVARHEGDPGPPENWEDGQEHLTERVWYPHAPLEHLEDPHADTSWSCCSSELSDHKGAVEFRPVHVRHRVVLFDPIQKSVAATAFSGHRIHQIAFVKLLSDLSDVVV
jgi:hypothetical protein